MNIDLVAFYYDVKALLKAERKKEREELLAKSKEQGWCEICKASLPKLNLPTSKWEE